MVDGWELQLRSRLLADSSIDSRIKLVRRFQRFTNEHPWAWTAADVEEFTAHLLSAGRAKSTARLYHLFLSMFMEYLTDERYPWVARSIELAGTHPVQICHERNTAEHLAEFEGRPERRGLTRDELQALFDHADDRAARITAAGTKGVLAALRDSAMLKTYYAYGLRRRENVMLDLADLHKNPAAPEFGRLGAVHVRYGKSLKGSAPRRRTVLTVFDWSVEVLAQYLEEIRPRFNPGAHPALWINERCARVASKAIEDRFAEMRDEIGLDSALTLHSLRHSYVTHCIEDGLAERFVSEQVGHSYSSTTAIYTAVSDDFKRSTLRDYLDANLGAV